MDAQPTYRFGRFTLNLARGCLQDGSVDLDLRPKSFEVLRQLVRHAGRLMSKDELVEAVWPNVTVSDDSLAHCIRDIRMLLKDRDEQFVKTVPRRGYMFVAPVSSDETTGDPAGAQMDRSSFSGFDRSKFQQHYRDRLKTLYADDAASYVSLSGQTKDVSTADPRSRRSTAQRRRLSRPEYHELLRSGDEIKRIKLESLNDVSEKYPCIILLGDPGSGKTSTLENLAYEFAQSDRLPVPLHLGSFNATESLEEFIVRGWMNILTPGTMTIRDLAAELQHCLGNGALLFLFDALNEMPSDRYAERCLALRQFIDRWSTSGNRFVVSCRVLDYGDELFGLQRVEILPLSDEKIRQLLENELSDDWKTLWQALVESDDRSRRLLEMARNPYMLTVMIDVFERHRELIQNRAELMRQFVAILFGWAGSKLSVSGMSAETAGAAIAVMAFEMQRRSGFGTTAKTEDVRNVLPREIEITPGWPPQPCPPDALFSLATSAKIIEMPVDRRTLRFYHQLLQEFFAAQHMLKLDPAQLVELWQWPWQEEEMPVWIRPENNFEPLPPPPSTGWEETTVLAANSAQHPEQLIEPLCRINPVLAARCALEDPARIEPSLRKRLIDALLATIANPNTALRVRIVAGDALGRLGDPRIGEMVSIPGGKFLMGAGRERHELHLPEFEIGRCPVTNAEYARFIAAGGYQQNSRWTESGWQEIGKERDEPRFWHDPRFNKPNQPVIGLSWYECVAYCRWLSSETGRIHRLPTEAEWEKAARGEDGRTYPWGNAFDASRLNAREGAQKVYCSTPVGSYFTGASPYGLFDCAGNSWEWCSTRWRKSYPYDAAENEWDDLYVEGQALRALRGGSWNYEAEVTQCAYRFRFEPFGWGDRGGFRVVSV